jgi:primosomal protein N' (replication factor Y) (superfamily II helicase)
VAVDAVGPSGGQTFTYALTGDLADVVPGEAVLVEYGRRRALGVVMSVGSVAPDRETKSVEARIRSDGPLLPPLQIELARHICAHYLAPPALVIRQMLAPGTLERVERVISRADDGGVLAEWSVSPARTREKVERRVRLTESGEAAARSDGGVARLGPRQVGVLAELLQAGDAVSAPRLAERHGTSAIPSLLKRGLVELETARVERLPLAGRPAAQRGTRPIDAELTPDQRVAAERVTGHINAGRHATLLLEGTTASGKSAVYAAAIAAALDKGRGALVIVPEIALAVPLLDRLRHDLGEEVGLLHSALSDGERADEWRRISDGEVRVVVGTRIAILAPIDPGVIVVDEEHDSAYKSDRTPRYQARDLAVVLGRLANAPVILGSATPDVATFGRAEAGEIEHLTLPRVAGAAARVEVVDLREELAEGNRGLISRSLADAIGALDINAGEQAILLINRRGSASVIVCRDCGYVQICPECQRPLVLHAQSLSLRCHHCGATAPLAKRCPRCDSPRIRYLGGGTERVEREVGIRWPTLRVGRLDRDVVERKGEAARVVDAFSNGEMDVLVGTALVAKGLDVPQVTLVGVVSADISLNLPDERAAERTYQLLVQAIGRAGRGEKPGRAIVQTYFPEHPVVQAVANADGAAFYRSELETRRLFRSPPFGRLVKLTVALEDRAAAERKANGMAVELRERATAAGAASDDRVEVLGPVPAYVARRAGRWRFHIVLRGSDPLSVLGTDPGVPWSVDVDPESLL